MRLVTLQSATDLLEVPAGVVLFLLPVALYAAVLWRRGVSRREILDRLGWTGIEQRDVLLALGVSVLTTAVALVTILTLPEAALDSGATESGVSYSLSYQQYADWNLGVTAVLIILFREAIYATLGEEIFFRGLLGGILFRRFGFRVGNLIQTVLFVLPHLVVVVVWPSLWPLVFTWVLAGWLLGWLYYRSGSIVPGWIAHTLGNTAAPFMFLYLT